MSVVDKPRPRTALLLSVVLNCVLAAVLSVLWFVPGAIRDWPMHGMMRMPSPPALERALPAQDHAVLRQVLDDHRDAIRDALPPVREARRRVHEALLAEPYDKARVDAAFSEMHARDADITNAVQAMMSDLAARISPEGRRALAKMAMRHGHGRHGGDHEDRRRHEERPPPEDPKPAGGA